MRWQWAKLSGIAVLLFEGSMTASERHATVARVSVARARRLSVSPARLTFLASYAYSSTARARSACFSCQRWLAAR